MKGTWNKLCRLHLRYAINANHEEAVFSHYIFKFFFLLLAVGGYYSIMLLLTDIVSNQYNFCKELSNSETHDCVNLHIPGSAYLGHYLYVESLKIC